MLVALGKVTRYGAWGGRGLPQVKQPEERGLVASSIDGGHLAARALYFNDQFKVKSHFTG
jgi:hypothetical protein